MFKRHLWPAVQWIYRRILQFWCYLARPFRRRSDSTELPLASPVLPSTPSFIQSQEPNFSIDAMRIFQLNNGPPLASHLARHKAAVQQMRTAPPNINRIVSLSSTDPSPGFSLLNDVVDNLEADLPSLYSSPPSSPSSSLHTPCIVVSGPMADITSRDDERLSLEFGLQREPRIAELASISQSELPLPRHVSPDIYGLAKRRNFKGPPIITNISRDFLPFPPTRLQGSVTPTDWNTQQILSRPKSALTAVTDFVRASTNIPSRNVSREVLVISPESQAAFIQTSPFSAESQSFFMDDHLNCSPEFDIHDLGIYADAGSALNLQVPRRKRTVAASEPLRTSLYMPTNSYGKPILAKGITDTTRKRTRTLSGVSHLSETASASIPDSPLSPALAVPASIPSHLLDVRECGSSGLSIRDTESDTNEQHIPPAAEVDGDRSVSSRLSLYASLVFPFSLEDSVSWDTGQDFNHHGIDFVDLNSVLGVRGLDDNVVVDNVGVLEYITTPVLSSSDHQSGNPPPVNAVNIEEDLVPDGNVMPVSSKNLLSPAIDNYSVAGSTTLSALETHTDYTPDVRDGVPREEESDPDCDLRVTSLEVLDGPFVSPGDSSVLLPVSGSKSCASNSQTFSSATSISSINCDAAHHVSVPVNNRRARRVGIYGPILSPVVSPNFQDTLLSIAEERLDQSGSERWGSPSRCDSRHGSTLRPLVLPMRVATGDVSTSGDRSFQKSPDMLLQSNRTSIGFPPPFPLPELPLYKTSLTPAIVASDSPRFEELDACQKFQSIPARSPAPLSTDSVPELEESYPDSDGADSTHAVNWGVAF